MSAAEALLVIDAELAVLRAATRSNAVSRLDLALVIDGIRSRVADVGEALELADLDEPIPFTVTKKETA